MHILVLNSGSSSLKFKLIRMPDEHEWVWGMVERIGETDAARLICDRADGPGDRRVVACPDPAHALSLIFDNVPELSHSGRPIRLLAHRLVHGGSVFSGPTLVDEQALLQMESLRELAPLHMPPALAVLRACRDRLPHVPQIACFDTTFYFSMPTKSCLYAVPREWHSEHGVRRFGFHGLSHAYVTRQASKMLGIASDQLKLISAHLGNGASITAFDRGRVLDTSMGFTPLEGLIMGTRAGYLDPSVLLHMQRRTGMTLDQMVEVLNTRSGLLAVSGVARDLRAIMEARRQGHAEAGLAVEMYVHTLRKYLGAYTFALSGAHALVFTGGVGENASEVRALVLRDLEEMGLILDADANRTTIDGRSGFISSARSRIKVLVIPANEERMIARQAHHLASEIEPSQLRRSAKR